MTQASESGAYLGGISTMLAQTDVCASCGRVHESRRIGFSIRQSHACPDVVLGSMPTLTEESQDEEDRSSSPMGELGIGAFPGAIPTPLPIARRSSGLAVPWPMPTQVEDFL